MRLLVIAATAALVMAACEPNAADQHAPAETELKSEKQLLVESIEANTEAFMAMVDGLSDQQLAFRESADRWSIAEVAEHIVISEKELQGFLQQAFDSEPAETGRPDSAVTDDQIVALLADRTQRFQAPATATPQGVYASVDDAVSAFSEARAVTMKMLQSDADFRKQFSNHPLLGPMDAHAWFVFLRGHCDRHLAQMQQVKDHEGYPAATI